MTKATDWTKYYQKKKSIFSTITQQFTLKYISQAIDDYCQEKVELLECGGGASCFAVGLCKRNKQLYRYDIVDSNELAVSIFDKMSIPIEHYGSCIDLTDVDNSTIGKYDFVYSIGLIEHFDENNRERVIHAHLNNLKEGGILFISFPTPTIKYRIIRKLMEWMKVWQFYDERPLTSDMVSKYLDKECELLECKINKKLPLSQMIMIYRKKK